MTNPAVPVEPGVDPELEDVEPDDEPIAPETDQPDDPGRNGSQDPEVDGSLDADVEIPEEYR